MTPPTIRPRRSLFRKYFITLFVAVAIPVIAGGVSEAWFGYRDQRARLDELLGAESQLATNRIQGFIDGIRDQLGWAVQLAWTDENAEAHRIDALRLLRQVPAIASITLVDGSGAERVFVSRLGLDRQGTGPNLSTDKAVAGARADKVWYGPVAFQHASEPYMTISVAGNRAAAGVALADINLKFIWDVVSALKVGETGRALVLDGTGRLIAHPDLSMVLRGDVQWPSAGARLASTAVAEHKTAVMTSIDGHRVIAVMAPVRGVDWTVVVEQPLREAFAPIRAALWRAAALILAGTALAAVLAYGLARSMAKPIRELEAGVREIAAGHFDHRVGISTGDELERLASSFNDMAEELASSREKSERINRLKRFLAPQVAEIVESSGDDTLLEGQRREVAVIFADLRRFTAFAARAEPEAIMTVLGQYHEAMGAIITRHGATLTNFAGDGLMVLVNAPVPTPDPAFLASTIAIEMREAAETLVLEWQKQGHNIGIGLGIAMGPATVGRIGYEGRLDYTAIGNVVNLASRLCAIAVDGQILLDPVAAAAIGGRIALQAFGKQAIKGYDEEIPVFAVTTAVAPLDSAASGA